MRRRQNRLPPLDYLIAFEAAARLGGFTAAAARLNLSQAAVSRQIKLLEEHLGARLFHRRYRSVVLTREGQAFLQHVSLALDQVEQGLEGLREAVERPRVTLAATQSVSTLWLMPRLRRLRQDHPNLDIHLVSTDIDAEALAGEHDLVILRGEGAWPDFEAELLLSEEVFPVCAPDYATDRKLHDLEALRRCTLITVASHHSEWMDWSRWLKSKGMADSSEMPSLSFNTYALSIQAAVDGLGVALGWRYLVDCHLAEGSLIKPLAESVRTRSGYFLLQRRGDVPSGAAQVVRDWLFAEARAADTPQAQHAFPCLETGSHSP
ncbi:LysR substrate-binding domain-containing protein [Aquibaculum arenosum]|uniref:LysR substrate-binding domain-containing protein n=1 Tax=Aquibaculum arenosum TaxID=3032591 RepID=A0ABT5YM04_9PROT|nr:LysR substrate-binding domain-containing protein [Fodinicurvata sp. CAU 1616]MDF2095948.1 LysR substrate-binding domain-containing protein [Fodinicurvata sp. CAU 1616]